MTEEALTILINAQVEENLNLDYKAAEALQKTDGKKKEIAKDVSAFANSNGGIIIYGIKEFTDQARKHLPEKIDAVDRNIISKEWLEQVINSNIHPKIAGIIITPIALSTGGNHVVYHVNIPQSTTAHQSADHRYYKRYNFESVAMEDYEVKDIINRQINPDLLLRLTPAVSVLNQNIVTYSIVLANSSVKIARDVRLTFQINDNVNCQPNGVINLNDISYLNPGKSIFESSQLFTIYKGLDTQVATIHLIFDNNITLQRFTLSLYADNMEPKSIIFGIEIGTGNIEYVL